MRPRIAVEAPTLSLMLTLIFVLMIASACTFYGEHSARTMAEATGGEGLERVFWKNVQAAKWVELERALASNYAGVTPSGTLDRAATLEQYRTWQLKDYAIGDLKTEMNGSTIVVTYTITLNGTAGSQPLPSAPQHMMTVWQQQKAGWIAIAHSVSQP
ncbi:MAG: nuclear transport factor 2 family protein [Acidobacteriia bacterium]|nr:nuclear transport factor 2 family protein [Terriglobia bacterium]